MELHHSQEAASVMTFALNLVTVAMMSKRFVHVNKQNFKLNELDLYCSSSYIVRSNSILVPLFQLQPSAPASCTYNLKKNYTKLIHYSSSKTVDEAVFMFENSTTVLFAIGSSEGSTQCVDIVFADDDLTERLECFSVGFSNGLFGPVCIEDNDGEIFMS